MAGLYGNDLPALTGPLAQPGYAPPLPGAPALPDTNDPDAGLTLPDGTPVSVAKRLIQSFEPGSQGYNAAFGQNGLPTGYQTGPNGFPVWDGNAVGNLYGGQYAGKNSRAAGMYQFEPDTWNPIASKLGITDFSPASQEKVATALLQQNGMSPWAPFNPRLSAAYSQYKSTGKMPANINLAALGGDPTATQDASAGGTDATSLPALQQLRGLALSGMLGSNITGDPTTAQALKSMVASPAVASLLSGGGNTSRTLAAMASGFLGGKGPAQSLAGGFGGLAKGMQEDQSDRIGLLKTLMDNQNGLARVQALTQIQLPQKAAEMMTTGMRSGAAAPSDLAKIVYPSLGMPVPDQFTGDAGKTLDTNFFGQKPLSPAAEKQSQDLIGQAGAANQLANQALMYKGAIDKGEAGGGFNLDRLSRAKYGVGNSGFWPGGPSSAGAQYNQFDAFNNSAAQNVLNLNKGAASDKRLDAAASVIQGGGLFSNQAGSSHMSALAAGAELSRRAAFQRYNKLMTDEKKPQVSEDQFNQLAGYGNSANPYSGYGDDQLTKALSLSTQGGAQAPTTNPTTSAASTAAPQGAGITGATPTGNNFSF